MNFHNINFQEDAYKLEMELTRMDGTYITTIPKDFIDNLNLKFNEVSFLDLSIPKYYTEKNSGNIIEYKHYDDFSDEMLINLNDEYTFIIKNVTEEKDIEKGAYKKIKTSDLSFLLQKVDCYLQDQSWQIRKDDVNVADGVMDEFTEQTMGFWSWTATEDAVKDDPRIGDFNKYRFLGAQSNWLQMFTDDLSNAYRSLFLIDSYNRKVSVCTENDLNETPELFLEEGNYLRKVNVNETKDKFVTKLRVTSNDQSISINTVNPLGGEYIEYYDEHTRSKMSVELQNALARYDIVINSQELAFTNLKNQLFDINKNLDLCSEKQQKLNEDYKASNAKRTEYFQNPEQFKNEIRDLALQIENIERDMATNLADVNRLNSEKKQVEDSMSNIAKLLDKKTSRDGQGLIFNQVLLSELFMFTQCGLYQDPTALTDQMLYVNGLNQLKELQEIVQEFDVADISSFISAVRRRDGKDWNKVLQMGKLVALKLKDDYMDVRLVEMNYTPASNKLGRTPKLTLKFSNKPYIYMDKRSNSSLNKQMGTKNAVFDGTKKWDSFQLGSNWAKTAMEQGINIAENWVAGRYQNSTKIFIDSAGILIMDAKTEQKCLFLSNGVIAFSNDGLKTVKTALTSDGVIADNLIGKILIGEKLIITSKDNDFIIGDVPNSNNKGFGLSIYENAIQRVFLGLETDTDGVRRAKLRIVSAKGNGVVLDENGILSEIQFQGANNVDVYYPLRLSPVIKDNVSKIKSALLFIDFYPFRVYSKGMESAGQVSSSFTTPSGGGVTSTTVGGYSTGNTSGREDSVSFVAEFATMPDQDQGGGKHYHPIERWQFEHTHYVSVWVSGHSHWCPDHYHSVTVSFGGHTHPEKYGCFDDTSYPSRAYIDVNGIRVASNVDGGAIISIPTNLLRVGKNRIDIYSNSRGWIEANISIETFRTW